MFDCCQVCGTCHDPRTRCRVVRLTERITAGDLAPGSLLAKRYRIGRLVHRGGMSVVYHAEDTRLGGRHVALKQLRLPAAATEIDMREAEAWFAREAYLLSTLQHALIPTFYTVFRENHSSYLVLEYVKGENLEDLARRGGLLPEHDVVAWGQALCGLLRYLHGLPDPVVFRDLKPANVLLRTTTRRLAVVDFGIARPMTPDTIGTVVGTPGYAAPEQYQGLAAPASDVFALGATLHRLLTGYDPEKAAPFRHPPVRSLRPTVTAEMANIVDQALRLPPHERPSAPDLARVLDRLARRPRARPTVAPPPVHWRTERNGGDGRARGLRAVFAAITQKLWARPTGPALVDPEVPALPRRHFGPGLYRHAPGMPLAADPWSMEGMAARQPWSLR